MCQQPLTHVWGWREKGLRFRAFLIVAHFLLKIVQMGCKFFSWGGLWALAVGLVACAIDSVPLPEDEPVVVGAFVDVEALFYTLDPPTLVGVPMAVTGEGVVVVSNRRTAERKEVATTEVGSFALAIEALVGDTIDVVYATPSGDRDTGVLVLQSSSVAGDADWGADVAASDDGDTSLPPLTEAGLVIIPPADGWLSLVAGPGTLTEGLGVVAANLNNGDAQSVAVTVDGGFEIRLRARAGDAVRIFVVAADISPAGGSALEIRVP